ncbi:MAG: DUF6037 family protein [Lachnospiraceae bacterium]|nr:DUF6037 family protein [Lachnospiraceae bacterium]
MNRYEKQFYFSRKMEKLQNLYKSMRELNVKIGVFTHVFNNIESSVIFDTRGDAWMLIFMKLILGDILEIPIKQGYIFTIDGDEKYKKFREYFEIAGGRGVFSIGQFIEHFEKQVPQIYELNDNKRNEIMRYDRIDSQSEGIYPIGMKNWELIHAQNPTLQKDKFHRTPENLAKTRELYPIIFSATKNMDISIMYGIKPGNKTNSLVAGNIDE